MSFYLAARIFNLSKWYHSKLCFL